jgi:integrase
MDHYHFRIVNPNGLKSRSYISFYMDGMRMREYNGNNLMLPIHPNRAKSEGEKSRLLKRLLIELKKAVKEENYPVISSRPMESKKRLPAEETEFHQTGKSLANAIERKRNSGLSYDYRKNLDAVYKYFTKFLDQNEMEGDIRKLKFSRIQEFLDGFSSSGTNYMNRRLELGVLFSMIEKQTGIEFNPVRRTLSVKRKAKLHKIYEKEQLKKLLSFLGQNHPDLQLCCLICYGCFLRPHQEIRNLKAGDIVKNCTEIQLSGDRNKSGRVRIVPVPDYVRAVLMERIDGLNSEQNIFTRTTAAYNRAYFHTQWQRLKKTMINQNLLLPQQTLYSFRHSAAANVYRKTKDLEIVRKLMGHSDMVVTLKYLRSLGEYTDDSLREFMPDL